jgi:hypothetical protein
VLQVALADRHATVDSLRAACQEVLTLGAAQEQLIEALLTLASGERGVQRREPFDLADIARGILLSRQPTGMTVKDGARNGAGGGGAFVGVGCGV